MEISFATLAGVILKYTVLLCLLILCASAVYATLVFCVSGKARRFVLRNLPIPERIKDSLGEGPARIRYRYYEEVRPDHDAVVSWILRSMNVTERWSLPADIINLFYPEPVSGTDAKLQEGARLPLREEHAALLLSKTIMTQRIQLMDRVAGSYRLWQITSLTGIALGMITTIIVAMSTTDFGKDIIAIRVLAIAFPALGTAAAAAFAFYAPQETWSQATRTLTSLSQLHGQMGLEIWDIKRTDGVENPELKEALSEWSKRFLDIQTIATAAGEGGAQQTGGGTATSGAGAGQAGAQQAGGGTATSGTAAGR